MLFVVVLAVLVFAAMSFWGDVDTLRANLETYAWEFFGYALALATGNYLIRFVRWELYLRALSIQVPRLRSALVFFAGFVMSISPGKVGEVLKSALLLRSDAVPVERSAPVVVAERLTDLMALVLLTGIGSLAVPGGGLLFGLSLAGVLALWAALSIPAVGAFFIKQVRRWERFAKLADKLEEAHLAIRALMGLRLTLVATALSVVSWGLECVCVAVVVMGFGLDPLPPLQATFTYAAPTLAGALAMLPGGLGVTEASMAEVLMQLASLDKSVAVATTLLVRISTLWWAVVLGALALLVFNMLEARRDRSSHAPSSSEPTP